ncbi:hypothetical protein BKA69DRAFT_1105704 [Paraphysoderma sedebokerense]|nr:hypothetical protein BKA69DRAFT_1105704 [Paraphysoderma sedebokerense]
MDRSFYFQYEAAMRHPYVEATLWGPGLPGYNANKTLSENIIAKHDFIFYDIIFLFGQCKNTELKAISNQVLVTIREFECYDGRCGNYIEWNNASIFQLAYMTDMSHYKQQSSRRVIKHSPHGADPRIFYKSPKSHRNIEVLLAGSTSTLYPLRRRWKKLIDEGGIRGTIFHHSGYFPISFSEIKVDEDWSEKEERFLQDRRIQVEKYADAMKRSLICVMDSSIYRYSLMKYVEATMAGCLIIADIPYDNPDMFRQFVVEVHEDDSDELLKQKVEYYLTHPEERIARVLRGQNLVRSFTWDVSIDRLIEAANDFKKGNYGIYASGQYIRGCAYKNPTEKNQWCS